ncbi:PepSY domain-containing protein [Bradyrhizobium canariense]|uniref:Peptidase propeptide and YPEB domain-containing protein n=1 Tax=Bradyrhizobium canariense TaxID=255045 RepID=A0A1H1QII1_9BRAD|nr:PepSY domain-containing protein [Bradyrhizobium canariense]SDS23196.1 Peptidase propeptide and YPEB domain-containing protein [Bradyrhizobium canariense]
MRKYIMPIIAVAMLGGATSAMAYDSGGLISLQMAMDVATDMGLATVSHTQFAGDEWQIEGRDVSGRYMEVDVDSTTGEVLNVDR